MATIFTRIMSGEIPCKKVYEDDHVFAFHDIEPQAPVHILIVTRAEISGLDAVPEDGDHRHILNAAKQIAQQEGLADGFRLVINQGEHGRQTVPHLHAHLLGGELLGGFGVPGTDH